ncbi:hypothetical protein JTB14_021289 [Gonioctena quinquepunctata]|nr:hypothetical protein JTB14_021289 [Gonioctena quinquepunctata]
MGDLPCIIMNLQLCEDIFKDVKFFISGEVHEKIVDLLKCGGAERLNYFSDYVTHLIVGENPEENDIGDANDVYEIPAVTPKWVLMSAALKRLVNVKSYLYVASGKLFSNLTFCFSGIREDRNFLWSLITYNGGIVQLNLTKKCDYLVITNTLGPKYERADSSDVKIITPHWIVEAVKNKLYPDYLLFHPKLIDWPKPIKHESTTAITGFEPEQVIEEDHNEEKIISDSTQALLEKLKQRMPWNQPSTSLISSSSDPVAPPNVVAPSFKSTHQSNQIPRAQLSQTVPQSQPQTAPPVSLNLPQIPRSPSTSLMSQQIPKSIIHHTPSQTSNFQDQHNPLNINRLIGQPQTRANLQLRGQSAQSQLHQQLLQQQNQSNVIQRTSGQVPIPQQILQQQLVQRQLAQRQLLQNQLNQNQLLQQQQANVNQQEQQHIGPNQHLNQRVSSN